MTQIDGLAPHVSADTWDVLVELIDGVITWDTDLAEPLGPRTLFVADLGFQSLDIVMLLIAVEARFQCQGLPFDDILTEGDTYVSDLAVGTLADFLEHHVKGA